MGSIIDEAATAGRAGRRAPGAPLQAAATLRSCGVTDSLPAFEDLKNGPLTKLSGARATGHSPRQIEPNRTPSVFLIPPCAEPTGK